MIEKHMKALAYVTMMGVKVLEVIECVEDRDLIKDLGALYLDNLNIQNKMTEKFPENIGDYKLIKIVVEMARDGEI